MSRDYILHSTIMQRVTVVRNGIKKKSSNGTARKQMIRQMGHKPTYRSTAHFYAFHIILLLLYAIVYFVQTLQGALNRLKLKLFGLAYNPSRSHTFISQDIQKLSKLPKNISTILHLKPEEDENGGISGLLNDSSEIVAWSTACGIAGVSIYEPSGVMKKHLPEFRRAVFRKLVSYYGTASVPTFIIRIPHLNMVYYGVDEDEDEILYKSPDFKIDIEISLLSQIDGKSTIVELTKVMAEMAKSGELKKKDITINFIDDELRQLVGPEPELLILFQPHLDLQGYPPWHIRLCEIFWEPNNEDVSYAIFLRALRRFSKCKINLGK